MELLLIKYGYFILFLGVAVEGEAFLLAATYLFHRGLLQLDAVLVVAIAANFIANQAYYLVAQSRGRAWLENRFKDNPHYRRALAWMSKHANWLLLVRPVCFWFPHHYPGCLRGTRHAPAALHRHQSAIGNHLGSPGYPDRALFRQRSRVCDCRCPEISDLDSGRHCGHWPSCASGPASATRRMGRGSKGCGHPHSGSIGIAFMRAAILRRSAGHSL
jgi:hypothetical protein